MCIQKIASKMQKPLGVKGLIFSLLIIYLFIIYLFIKIKWQITMANTTGTAKKSNDK